MIVKNSGSIPLRQLGIKEYIGIKIVVKKKIKQAVPFGISDVEWYQIDRQDALIWKT